ncbi:hypothetical protein KR200_010653 [Drosophila serrata]|nr:hypothetical protein KR200_010653 [Drosophila serrata]
MASSVNSAKVKFLDDSHSDDSGNSASSQSNNNVQAKQQQPLKLTVVTRKEQRYIGPNCSNMTPEPPLQIRTISMPQLSGLPYQGRNSAAYSLPWQAGDTQYSPAGLGGHAFASRLCARLAESPAGASGPQVARDGQAEHAEGFAGQVPAQHRRGRYGRR